MVPNLKAGISYFTCLRLTTPDDLKLRNCEFDLLTVLLCVRYHLACTEITS